MDNQHKLIKGYRDLTESEIALMNLVKSLGENCESIQQMLLNNPEVDKRWAAIGTAHLQQGVMAWVRSIAKPTSF